jgi:hypothetical protein
VSGILHGRHGRTCGCKLNHGAGSLLLAGRLKRGDGSVPVMAGHDASPAPRRGAGIKAGPVHCFCGRIISQHGRRYCGQCWTGWKGQHYGRREEKPRGKA